MSPSCCSTSSWQANRFIVQAIGKLWAGAINARRPRESCASRVLVLVSGMCGPTRTNRGVGFLLCSYVGTVGAVHGQCDHLESMAGDQIPRAFPLPQGPSAKDSTFSVISARPCQGRRCRQVVLVRMNHEAATRVYSAVSHSSGLPSCLTRIGGGDPPPAFSFAVSGPKRRWLFANAIDGVVCQQLVSACRDLDRPASTSLVSWAVV